MLFGQLFLLLIPFRHMTNEKIKVFLEKKYNIGTEIQTQTIVKKIMIKLFKLHIKKNTFKIIIDALHVLAIIVEIFSKHSRFEKYKKIRHF
jgi:hypothetical protein